MRALIIGAGVAGPATAMALQKAGFEAVIVEAHQRDRGDVGSYFTVSPNGLDALAAIDALAIATREGFPTRRNVMRNAHGSVLGDLPLGTPLADGTPALTMKRSRLAAALADEAVRRGSGSSTAAGSSARHGTAKASSRRSPMARRSGRTSSSARTVSIRPSAGSSTPALRRADMSDSPISAGSRRAERRLRSSSSSPRHGSSHSGARRSSAPIERPTGDVVWFVNAPRDEISRAERGATSDEAWQGRLAGLFDGDAGPAAGAHPGGPARARGRQHVRPGACAHVASRPDDRHRRRRARTGPELGPGRLDGARGWRDARDGAARQRIDRRRLRRLRGGAARASREDRRLWRPEQQLQDARSYRVRRSAMPSCASRSVTSSPRRSWPGCTTPDRLGRTPIPNV